MKKIDDFFWIRMTTIYFLNFSIKKKISLRERLKKMKRFAIDTLSFKRFFEKVDIVERNNKLMKFNFVIMTKIKNRSISKYEFVKKQKCVKLIFFVKLNNVNRCNIKNFVNKFFFVVVQILIDILILFFDVIVRENHELLFNRKSIEILI